MMALPIQTGHQCTEGRTPEVATGAGQGSCSRRGTGTIQVDYENERPLAEKRRVHRRRWMACPPT